MKKCRKVPLLPCCCSVVLFFWGDSSMCISLQQIAHMWSAPKTAGLMNRHLDHGRIQVWLLAPSKDLLRRCFFRHVLDCFGRFCCIFSVGSIWIGSLGALQKSTIRSKKVPGLPWSPTNHSAWKDFVQWDRYCLMMRMEEIRRWSPPPFGCIWDV